jgi:hypothetical protein
MGGEVEVWCKELNWPCTASDTPYHVFMSIILLKNVPLPNNKVKITASWIFQLEPIKYKYLFNTLILEFQNSPNDKFVPQYHQCRRVRSAARQTSLTWRSKVATKMQMLLSQKLLHSSHQYQGNLSQRCLWMLRHWKFPGQWKGGIFKYFPTKHN